MGGGSGRWCADPRGSCGWRRAATPADVYTTALSGDALCGGHTREHAVVLGVQRRAWDNRDLTRKLRVKKV